MKNEINIDELNDKELEKISKTNNFDKYYYLTNNYAFNISLLLTVYGIYIIFIKDKFY